MGQRDVLATSVLAKLAIERRRVVARWRLFIVLRRLATESNPQEPEPRVELAASLIRRLVDRHDLARAIEFNGVYLVTSPYAASIPLSEEHIVQEGNPSAYFSHLTALAHHGLTDSIRSRIYATIAPTTPRVPLGTTEEDWLDLDRPVGQVTSAVRGVPIVWTSPRTEAGVAVFNVHGASVYMTNRERTLLDVLHDPRKAQGVANVLRAWRRAAESWNLEQLLEYADSGPVVRQRVGWLVERLGQTHPRLESWRTKLQRGGSMKLVASEPYSPVFSERWSLSLNASDAILGILDD